MKHMTESQYRDINRAINYLTPRFSNMPETIVEEIVWGEVTKLLGLHDPSLGSWYTFFSGKCYLKLIDEVRRYNRFQERLIEETELLEEYTNSSEYLVLHDSFYDELESIIDAITLEQRNVLYLYVMGENITGMMKILGLSRKYIKDTKAVVLDILQARLSDYGSFYKR